MKKINFKWVAFGILVAALIGLGTWLIIRETSDENWEGKVDKVEVIRIGPDTTNCLIEEDTTTTVEVVLEEVVDSIEDTIEM